MSVHSLASLPTPPLDSGVNPAIASPGVSPGMAAPNGTQNAAPTPMDAIDFTLSPGAYHPQTSKGTGLGAEAGARFQALLGELYHSVTAFTPTVPKLTASIGAPADPVGKLKNELAPAPPPFEAGSSDKAFAAPNEGTQLLIASFDHALSLALLSQVISGISSTTSTLLRQT